MGSNLPGQSAPLRVLLVLFRSSGAIGEPDTSVISASGLRLRCEHRPHGGVDLLEQQTTRQHHDVESDDVSDAIVTIGNWATLPANTQKCHWCSGDVVIEFAYFLGGWGIYAWFLANFIVKAAQAREGALHKYGAGNIWIFQNIIFILCKTTRFYLQPHHLDTAVMFCLLPKKKQLWNLPDTRVDKNHDLKKIMI